MQKFYSLLASDSDPSATGEPNPAALRSHRNGVHHTRKPSNHPPTERELADQKKQLGRQIKFETLLNNPTPNLLGIS